MKTKLKLVSIDDIKFPLRVRVTQNNILYGTCQNPETCVISAAIKDALARRGQRAHVEVFDSRYIEIGYEPVYISGHKDSHNIIDATITIFDKLKNTRRANRLKVLKPFSFTISGPK